MEICLKWHIAHVPISATSELMTQGMRDIIKQRRFIMPLA